MDQRDDNNTGKQIDMGEFEVPNQVSIEKSLSLERNNSLEMVGFRSIQNPLPVPINMLSIDNAFQPQNRQYQQKQSNHEEFLMHEVDEANEDDLIQSLNLDGFNSLPKKDDKSIQNTKNVLRNFGNAQNHYVLYHRKARKHIQQNIRSSEDFDDWVRTLKLQNFENFKKAWTTTSPRLFTRIYKELCWQFYTDNAVPYVMSSRIKKRETQGSHLRHIYRFLEGLGDPNSFNYFKKQ